jgi:replication factor C subunit 3/5
MLWVDKHRPNTLDKMDFHFEQANQLRSMVQAGDFPHIMMYGPPGSGKKTRVMAMLRETFGNGVEKLRSEMREFKGSSDKKIEIMTVSSNYHIELNPSDVGFQDRVVIMGLIKELAQSQTIETSKGKPFKVVVLTEVDNMTKEAQQALRRTMEKYQSNCRIVLLCNNACKVIEPLRSRCLGVRVASPDSDEICNVLQGIAAKEALTLPPALANSIAQQSQRNLRRAILSLEACKAQHYPFSDDTPVQLADWEIFIAQLAAGIVEEQSTKRLHLVRGKLFELLANCIPPSIIFEMLSAQLMKKMDNTLKHEIAHWAAHYEHQSRLGTKPVFHLEAFVAKVMKIYKSFLLSLGMDM